MEASVVMRGLILHFATTVPLSKPTSAPEPSPAAIPKATLPVWFITTVAITPAQASTEPTDRSKFPEAKQKSIVQETIPTLETASSNPCMFTFEKKLSTQREQPRNSAAITTSIPARSQKEIK